MPFGSGRTVFRIAAGIAMVSPLLTTSLSPAWADPVTPEQAQSLEAQMRSWLVGAIGPNVVVPKRPIEVTAAGDHFQLAVPFAVLLGSAGAPAAGGGTVTASLKPLDQNRWALDDVTVPSPGHFAFDAGTGAKKMPLAVDMSFTGQNSHAIFDQSFATPSTMTSSVASADIHITGADQDQVQHFDGYTANARLTPTTAGRVDVTEDAAVKGLSIKGHTSDGHQVDMAAEHLSIAGHLDDVDRLKVLAAVQAITKVSGGLATAMQPPAAPPPPPRPGQPGAKKPAGPGAAAAAALDRTALREMVMILRDIAAGGEIDEAFDGIRVSVDGHGGGAEHARLGLGATAPGGVLNAHFDMSIDGLSVADLPPAMADYLPRHFKLRPFVTGISMADLTGMALDATGPNGGKTPDPAVLFSHGGITFGLETLAIDLGDSAFTATANMVASSPSLVSGKAQIKAHNFDALMQRVQKDPMLAQGFPVMVMARGMGKPAGDDMVWDIVVDNDAVSVNGTDLTAMMGGARK